MNMRLSELERQRIEDPAIRDAFKAGEHPRSLAQRYGRTRQAIYNALARQAKRDGLQSRKDYEMGSEPDPIEDTERERIKWIDRQAQRIMRAKSYVDAAKIAADIFDELMQG